MYSIRTYLLSVKLLCVPILCAGALATTANAQQRILQVASDEEDSSSERSSAANHIAVQNAILKKIETTTVSGQLTGILMEMNVQPGDVVVQNQEIGKINDVEVKLKLEQLRSRVEMLRKKQLNRIDERLAEKSKQVADNEYQRALRANQYVADTYPPSEVDRLKLIADKTVLELERAVHERDMLHYEVQNAANEYKQLYETYRRHKVLAPISGVVVSVEKRVGEWVEPGSELVRIVRIDRLRVEGSIPLSEALLDLVGRRAEVMLRHEHGDIKLPAIVTFVSPDANPVNSLVNVYLEVDNSAKKLRPGLRVDAAIQN